MNIFWTALKNSLQLPKKQATFTLNRIRMDITVFYLFILLAIASLPALIDQIINRNELEVMVNLFFLFIYFFIVYYLVFVIIAFIFISLIALIGFLISQTLKRKLKYHIFWKIAAFATTIPLLLFTIISLFYPLSSLFIIFATIYIMYILIKMTLIYPRRRT